MIRLDVRVPIQIRCRIRIGAAVVGIPVTGQTVVTAVLPADIPTIDCTGTGIGNSDGGSKAVTPLIGHNILTTGVNLT